MCKYHLFVKIESYPSLPLFLSDAFDTFDHPSEHAPNISKSNFSIKDEPTFLNEFEQSSSNSLELQTHCDSEEGLIRIKRLRKDRQKFSRWRHKEYQCDECERMFTLKHNLQNHVIQYHMGCRKLQKPCSSSKCYVCGKIYSTPSILAEHLIECHNIHIKKEECSHCHQKFLSCSALQRHVKTEHAKRSKICPFDGCELKFKFIKDLNEHIRQNHKKEYTCSICHLSFNRSSSRTEHEQTHMGPRLKRQRRQDRILSQMDERLNPDMVKQRLNIKLEADEEDGVIPRQKFRPELEAIPIIRKVTKKMSKDEILAKIK